MFKFLKELFQLAKMLFKNKPSDMDKVELLEMKSFPFKGYKYMMWCGKVIYRSDKKDRIESELGTDLFKISMNHETIHLCQAQYKGTWFKYYISYLWEWIKGNPIVKPYSSAYYTIPYEMEAYGNEDDFSYILNYNGKNLKKYYTIKDRKKSYKEQGGSSYKWKEYCKNIL